MHFLGFAAQHRGLIRDADGLQMNVRIEPLRIGAFEFLQELGFVAAVQDVIADVIGFRQSEDDEVMSAAIGPGLRAGGFGFLVPGFAVNDAGDGILGILAHAFPNAHHVAAGRVHEQAAFFFEFLARGDFRAESRDDDDVVGLEADRFLHPWSCRQ